MGNAATRLLPSLLICAVVSACGGGGKKDKPMPVVQPGPDPLLELQWHLLDSGQSGGARADLNVAPVWNSCEDGSCRGEGVRIAVVDDGLEIRHPDLWPNIVPGASHNYSTGGSDPSPRATSQDSHGTAVAGLAAARDFNSEGGRGVAPRAGLVGYNLLQNPTTANEADAMTRGRALMAISTNSWGAPDRTGRLQQSNQPWRDAIDKGLREGRGGLGIVYTWAAGNGHQIAVDPASGHEFALDNANYDGRANYYGVLAIGAVDHRGIKAHYSEEGANLWLVAPGGSGGCSNGLLTTDLTGAAGLNDGTTAGDLEGMPNYTRCMAGTSAAAPLAAGVAALLLQARPELSWRDARLILAASAYRNDPDDQDWQTNSAGYQINHKYGFGLVDAQAAVDLAKTWTLLPALQLHAAPDSAQPVDVDIPDADVTGIEREIVVSGSGIGSIEWVDIEFSSTHSYAGDLTIILTSPAGTQSRLAERHLCRAADCTSAITGEGGLWSWRFGSARHLGEAADGVWKLRVTDTATTAENPGRGKWVSWRLVIRGH